uniref:RPN1 N-terminal domain-containing protein n=1 Tax=Oryza rufipogon TaxID=4529 RepID=A0A0E0N779_ORYRU
MLALDIAYTIYMKFEDLTSALRIALLLDNKSIQYMKQVYTATEDLQPKKQFSFIIARHGLAMEIDNEIAADDNDKEGLQEIFNNTKLSEGYLTLARDIEVMEPKSLEDIYKVHLIDGGGASSSLDSARQNLAATFVNAFVNAGFGQVSSTNNMILLVLSEERMNLKTISSVQDKLMTAPSDSSSSGASGNCLFKNKEHGKASAAASLALAILMEYINKNDTNIRIGAILGFGIAYAGSQKEECNEAEPAEPIIRLLPVALGLLYLGKQESVEATTEVSKTFDEKIRKYCDVTLMSLAYAGTGNVLKHLEKGETHQGPAVLGIALIAMAEELGAEMAVQPLERLLQYGEQNIRRAVPLALGILCISNPKVNVMDTLSRLCHDADADVSMNGPWTPCYCIACLPRYEIHHSRKIPLHSLNTTTFFTFIVLAMQVVVDIRMLLTVDEDLKPISVPVRVGQAVDVIHSADVRYWRALVILKKNPEYNEE